MVLNSVPDKDKLLSCTTPRIQLHKR